MVKNNNYHFKFVNKNFFENFSSKLKLRCKSDSDCNQKDAIQVKVKNSIRVKNRRRKLKSVGDTIDNIFNDILIKSKKPSSFFGGIIHNKGQLFNSCFEDDEVFPEAVNSTPITENFMRKNTLVIEGHYSGRRLHRKSKFYTTPNDIQLGAFFEEEYFKDNFSYLTSLEEKQLLSKNDLEKYSVIPEDRMAIVDWMIKAQQMLDFPEHILFIAIYILDTVLWKTKLPKDMYQLVAVTSLWISNKATENFSIKTSQMLSLCGHAFIPNQLKHMEVELLKTLNFKLPLVEPSIFVDFYLKMRRMEMNELLRLCCHYIINCFTLHKNFSTIPPSLLAFFAVNTAISKVIKMNGNFFSDHMNEEEIPDFSKLDAILTQLLENMNDTDFKFRSPYFKYETKKVMQWIKSSNNNDT